MTPDPVTQAVQRALRAAQEPPLRAPTREEFRSWKREPAPSPAAPDDAEPYTFGDDPSGNGGAV